MKKQEYRIQLIQDGKVLDSSILELQSESNSHKVFCQKDSIRTLVLTNKEYKEALSGKVKATHENTLLGDGKIGQSIKLTILK